MISLFMLLFLAWQFYLGYMRGLFLQGFYSLGSGLAFLGASLFYQDVANQLTLWLPFAGAEEGMQMRFFTSVPLFDLDQVFYAGCAFIGLYLAFYLVVRLLGVFLHAVKWRPLDTTLGHAIAGGLSVWVTTWGLSLGFSLLATVPYAAIQEQLASSLLARFLINYNPVVTQLIRHFWVNMIVK